MKQIFIIFALMVTSLWACDPETKSENKEQNTMQNATEESASNSVTGIILSKLPQEGSERYKKNDATVISLFSAEIATGEHLPLLEKLFPGGNITPANATELVDAFDIAVDAKKYCVLITYAQAPGGYFVIDKFYVFENAFHIDLLTQITN